MVISLLTNTGLQFWTQEIRIEINKSRSNSLFFYQEKKTNFFDNSESLLLHSVYFHEENEEYYLYNQLDFDEKGNLITNNFTTKIAIAEEEVVSINNPINGFLTFMDQWIPIPYFNKNAFNDSMFIYGPTGWARMYIKLLEKKESSYIFSLNLSFDTKTNAEFEDRILLTELDTNENRNLFYLCNDTHLNMKFISNDKKNLWIDEALKIVAKQNKKYNKDSLQHLIEYLFLINYISKNKLVPNIYVYNSDEKDYINVDLVLDIGNSRTCGLLFEDSMSSESVNFTSVKKLEIRNLTEPWKIYTEPFSMNLTFTQTKFGAISIPNYTNIFSWPSVLRLGEEAQILLNKFDISQFGFDEPLNTMSSPKRYLWDKTPSIKPWEYIILSNNETSQHERNHVVYESLTGFIGTDGKILEKATNASSNWSRNTLMVFVFIEIINHAKSQINSYNFRSDLDGDSNRLRKLRSIILTCPTAMSEFEQFELRESAMKAVILLEKYYSEIQEQKKLNIQKEFDFSSLSNLPSNANKENQINNYLKIEIIPRPKDVAKEDHQLDERLDWIYDEASCSQINFIYSEIAKKYSSNYKDYFDIYGKKENGHNTLTVATLDIGGGTTDLMINKYRYDENDKFPHLTPEPIFYETYSSAGDDLVKEIIHQLLIDGADQYDPRGYGNGQIRRYAESKGCKNVAEKILHFFGEQSASMGNQHRYYRKYFVKQILVPIANKLLESAKGDNLVNKAFTYDDIFYPNYPNTSLIQYINEKFGDKFDFREIQWEFSIDRINNIIDYRFKKLFKQISFMVYNSSSDIFLLAGKPSEIKHIRDIFMNEYPISPDRIISLANYQIGTWFPFTDPKGFILDPKTTVAVGAMIYALSGRFKRIHGFKLNTESLKIKLKSNANYVGNYNPMFKNIDTIYLSPEKNEYEIKNASLPIFLAMKQVNSINYPSKPLYQINFSRDYFRSKLLKDGVAEKHLEPRIEEELVSYRNRNYNFRLVRDISISKEEIKIENIEDCQTNQVFSDKLLGLILIPINFESDHWMDTGEFKVLNFN